MILLALFSIAHGEVTVKHNRKTLSQGEASGRHTDRPVNFFTALAGSDGQLGQRVRPGVKTHATDPGIEEEADFEQFGIPLI
jgi:hypothetical protein